jgi:hypothetical protein
MKGYKKICFLAGLLLMVTLFTTADAEDEHPPPASCDDARLK